jgi:hypothetical protein
MPDQSWQDELKPVVRTAQIIVFALVQGCVFFLAIALYLVNNVFMGPILPEVPMVVSIGVAVALAALAARLIVLSWLVRRGRRRTLDGSRKSMEPSRRTLAARQPIMPPGIPGELAALYMTTLIVSGAILEGATFFLLIVYLLTASLIAQAVAVFLLFLLVAHIPTRSRVVAWIEEQMRLLDEEREAGP